MYVIDGVMKDEGQFNNLDVNDIESISILKTDLQLFMELRQLMGLFWLQQKGTVNEKPRLPLMDTMDYKNGLVFRNYQMLISINGLLLKLML